jgi:trehalose 6-phosphate phosphatase
MKTEAASLPSAFDAVSEIASRKPAVFLDYDGTLTPIVNDPDQAILSEGTRELVKKLGKLCPVAIISGRDLADVQSKVGIDSIIYAGSHGFDVAAPDGTSDSELATRLEKEFIPALDAAERELHERMDSIAGALVDRKKFSIAAHYRNVAEEESSAVGEAVDQVLALHDNLRKTTGKKVFELQPKLDWHKGKALQWLRRTLKLDAPDIVPVFIGDDVTDEDAFEAIREDGIGIIVREEPRPTFARYALETPAEVARFLGALHDQLIQS